MYFSRTALGFASSFTQDFMWSFENTEKIPCTSSFSFFDLAIKKSSTYRPLRHLETVLSFAQKFEMENLIASKFSTTTTEGQGHMADWG